MSMLLESNSPSTKAPWHREPFVWMIILIPVSSVVVGIIMLGLAIATYDGLVVDDYYKKGLEINRSLARDRAATGHDLASNLRLIRENGTIEMRLHANRGFRRPETIELKLFHSTRAGFDQQIRLRRASTDLYTGPLPRLTPGNWHVQLEANEWRLMGGFNHPYDAEIELLSGAP